MVIGLYNKLYNKVLSKPIGANVIQSFLYRGLMIMGQFYLIPLTINVLDKQRFGYWMTILTIANWFAFFDFGVGNSLRNKLVGSLAVKDHDTAKKYITTTYFFVGFTSLFLGIVFFIINFFTNVDTSLFKISASDQLLHKSLLCAVSLILVRLFLMTINYINYALQKSSKNDMIQFLIILFTITAILILRRVTVLTLLDIVLVYSLVPIIVYTIYTFIFFANNKKIAPGIKYYERSLLKTLASMGGKFFFIQLVAMLLFTIPTILIGKYFGAANVTEYSIANRLYGSVFMVFSIILSPFWSAFTKASVENDVVWIKRNFSYLRYLSYGFIISLLVLYFFSPSLYKAWIGSGTSVSPQMNRALMLYNLSLVLIAPLNFYMNGKNILNIQVYLSIINTILYIPLVHLLTEKLNFGASGIVIVSVLLLFFNYIVSSVLLKFKKDAPISL